MARAYLGIVTSHGLESLTLETEHAARFLQRRCYGRAEAAAVLCWATLLPQDAAMIQQLARLGLYEEALARLEFDSVEWGSLPPADAPCDAA
jgi:hypothetical protein